MKLLKLLRVPVAMTLASFMLLSGCTSKPSTSSTPSSSGPSTSETAKAPEKSVFDGQRIRIIIGSTSTGGDTYLTADTVGRYLSAAVNANAKVDAIGAGRALEEITKAKGDGSTMMIFHDMTYLGVSFGAYDEAYKLENFIVGPRMSINPGYCLVGKADLPYNNLKEMADWLKANPNETVKLAIESGGLSHLGFIAFYDFVAKNYGQDVADRVKAYVSGSTDEKRQAIWDGNCDAMFADVTNEEQYTKDGVDAQIKMKFLGIYAGERIEGKDIPTFAEQGITLNGEPFIFDKEFTIFLPKDTPQNIIDELDAACKKVAEDPKFQEELAKYGYIPAYLSTADNQKHMYEKRDIYDALIKNAPSLDALTAN